MSKAIQAELVALTNKDGMIDVATVHKWARAHPKSALYAALEWADEAAAEQWRHWQIRRLIAVHVVNDTGERTLISLSTDRMSGGGYRMVDSVGRNRDLRAIMLQDALNELQRVEAKYKRITELSRVWEEASAAREATRRKRAA